MAVASTRPSEGAATTTATGTRPGGQSPDRSGQNGPTGPNGPAGAARRRRRRKLGLRSRVTATFALGALVLSGALASITYFSVRASLTNQEVSSLEHEAISDAEALRANIQVASGYTNALTLLNAHGASSILENGGLWYPSDQSIEEKDIPPSMRHLVMTGVPSEQLVSLGGTPELIVGLQFRTVNGAVAYFQVFDLGDLASTLKTLVGALSLAAAVTTVLGAIVGSYAANRSLRPLHQTAQAALSIAGGDLDTRLATDAFSDLAVLTSSFNQMADRLQERIEREARFTSDVNHELRSPLTTVATAMSVLEGRREELPDRAAQALDLLSAEVRRFRRLVDDLLEISRLDAGLGEVNNDEVSLGPLIRHTVAATRCQVMVEVPPAVADRRVLVDKLRFERVVANLVDNAIRYAGGPTRVTAEADARWGRVAIEDRGPGVPAEERERIFERFARGTSGRRRGAGEGTGLGLAIVAEHARLLGGRVWVEPNGARGSRFVLEIPVHPPADDQAASS